MAHIVVVVQEKIQDRSLYSRQVIWRKSIRMVRLIAGSKALGRFHTEAYFSPNNIFHSCAVEL